MLPVKKSAVRVLLTAFKNETNYCQSCKEPMSRKVLMKGTEHMLKRDWLTLDHEVTTQEWEQEKKHWSCVCRRCATVLATDASSDVDQKDFYFWLLGSKNVSKTSIREYTARLRRLTALLSHDQFEHALMTGELESLVGDVLGESDVRNYARVLSKYREFCFSKMA